jgi:phosphomannomutase
MAKKKIQLSEAWDTDALLLAVADTFKNERVTTIDGVKIDFDDSWIHLRKSNTEPIIRLYAEAQNNQQIQAQVEKIETAIAAFVASA